MHFADEYFVRAQDQVLHHSQHAVHDWFATLDAEIKRRVARLTDDDVLGLDDPAWSRQLASELEVAAPVLDTAAAEVVDGGTVTVDCAGAPGVTFSSMEWGGAVLRDGNRMRLVVPGAGPLSLLASRITHGGMGRRVDIHPDRLERVYGAPWDGHLNAC